MINLLLKLKSLIPDILLILALLIVPVSYGLYWHHQYNKAQAVIAQQLRENASCQASNELLDSAVQRWKAAAAQYDKQLKRREALVAKLNAKSKKQLKAIQQKQFSSNCNEAIKQAVSLL